MSRSETSKAPRARSPAPEPKPAALSTPAASDREGAKTRRLDFVRPINLERRARFVRFGLGGA